MNYKQDEFLRLIEEIEFQDGTYLDDEECRPRRVMIRTSPKGRKEPFYLAGCNNPSFFEIPYGRENGTHGRIKVCAVDDHVGAWPRFQHAVSGSG